MRPWLSRDKDVPCFVKLTNRYSLAMAHGIVARTRAKRGEKTGPLHAEWRAYFAEYKLEPYVTDAELQAMKKSREQYRSESQLERKRKFRARITDGTSAYRDAVKASPPPKFKVCETVAGGSAASTAKRARGDAQDAAGAAPQPGAAGETPLPGATPQQDAAGAAPPPRDSITAKRNMPTPPPGYVSAGCIFVEYFGEGTAEDGSTKLRAFILEQLTLEAHRQQGVMNVLMERVGLMNLERKIDLVVESKRKLQSAARTADKGKWGFSTTRAQDRLPTSLISPDVNTQSYLSTTGEDLVASINEKTKSRPAQFVILQADSFRQRGTAYERTFAEAITRQHSQPGADGVSLRKLIPRTQAAPPACLYCFVPAPERASARRRRMSVSDERSEISGV